MNKLLVFLLVFSPVALMGQEKTPSGNRIISDPNLFLEEERRDPSTHLVELKSLIPTLQYDLRYARKKNFSGVRVYPRSTRKTYLRQQPAEALAAAAAELGAQGLRIKIWDAYRPYAVTVKFWNLIGDERYVANPAKGSGHNRGIAVDLTLVDEKTGRELEMPTGFDDFSESAHHGYTQLNPKKTANRELLRSTMVKHGFIPLETEWWHYYWPSGDRYTVMNISFKQLKALQHPPQQQD